MKVGIDFIFCVEDEKAYNIKGHVDPLEKICKIQFRPHFEQLVKRKKQVKAREDKPNVLNSHTYESVFLADFCMLHMWYVIIFNLFKIIAVSLIMEDQVKKEDAIGNELWEHVLQIIVLELLVEKAYD